MRSKRRHIKARDPHDDVEYSKASGADSGVFVENDSPKSFTCMLIFSLLFIFFKKRLPISSIHMIFLKSSQFYS